MARIDYLTLTTPRSIGISDRPTVSELVLWFEDYMGTRFPETATIVPAPYARSMCMGISVEGIGRLYLSADLNTIMLQSSGEKAEQLFKLLTANGDAALNWRCTRIDIAQDYLSPDWTMEDVAQDYRDKVLFPQLETWSDLQSSGGRTLTFGSRTSQFYTRVYDKGREQGVMEADRWIRVEYECKGALAQRVWRAMCETDVNADDVFFSLSGRGMEYNYVPFVLVLQSSESVDLTIGRKQTDTWVWLFETVLKAFARASTDDHANGLKFMYAVENILLANKAASKMEDGE